MGLEAFRIVGSRLLPDVNAIADFSSISNAAELEETVAEALRFARTHADPDLFHEVTLAGDVSPKAPGQAAA